MERTASADRDRAELDRVISDIYQREARQVFATLVRLLGDFDLAEDALHEAFATAVAQWPGEGVPANPRAWLVSTGRFRAIDAIRRKVRFDKSVQVIARRIEQERPQLDDLDEAQFRDDQLRLIFTCCHPALSPNTQVALTLREVCGLKTEEVARAFLTSNATIAQRIVRGKAKIRDANIPYEVPLLSELPQRLDSVLAVIYLVFNEGYSASSGDSAIRADLSGEAIRLGKLLNDLLPDAEVMGLVALMLLHESRREARTDSNGDLILLEDQDRLRWNRDQIADGKQFVERAMATGRIGTYTVQAAISAVHADATGAADTDWARIVAWYDLLMRAEPSPVVELNRAVAIAMRDGAEHGLELIEAILSRGDLVDYHLAHAARADLCRRLGLTSAARAAYEQALALAKQAPERRFLDKRLRELG
ncbi:MAG: RNA polymerase sigma factor [Pirellulales bacterium]